MVPRAQTVTILFTDLVGSTELLQRAGDGRAQHIFKSHHHLLREAVQQHRGHEVKWLGDGIMVAFESTQDAVRCAIAMQQSCRRPMAGERLEVRAGINVGETFVEDGDYFGTPVVIARRLCDRAAAGQILAGDLVARLAEGRDAGFTAKDLGPLELKGIDDPVRAVEIVYEHDPMALIRSLPFVGRGSELDAMLAKLARARDGQGSVILLAGEPGIGKTRLTEEFCARASSSASVIRGNCFEGEVAAPFGPWAEALRSLIGQTPDAHLRDALGAGAPDIAVLLPEIRLRIPDLDDPPHLEPEAERARLFESIIALLGKAADLRPLVVFFDDLHWCDRPSLALLEQFARRSAGKPVVVVGSYRDVEVDRLHPLSQTLAALRRLEHYERVAIRGFTQESVYDLLAAIEPSEQAEPARQELARALHGESEGNPFFIREVLNNLVETGKLRYEGGHWTGTVGTIEELGIPEGVREVIVRRLARLSETCNRMLQRASAMTTGFTWEELCALCDESQEDLLDALDEALASQLIVELPNGAYAFTHALVRATLYDALSTPRRVLVHRRAAEALEALYAGDIDAHLDDLAGHYVASAGGEVRKAIEYSIRAGDRAMRLVAWEEAAAHYQRALDAMSIAKYPDDERRCRTLISLAECHRCTGRAADAVKLARQAAGMARGLRSPELLSAAAIVFDFSAYLSPQDVSGERLALLDEALVAAGADDPSQRVHLLCRRVQAAAAVAGARSGSVGAGFQAYAGHKDPLVLAQAREALALAQGADDARAIWEACLTLHNYSWTPDNVAERRDLIELGYAAAARGGLAVVAWERAMVELEVGDIAAFRRSEADYAEFLERSRYQPAAFVPRAMHVALEAVEGRLAAAEDHWNAYTSSDGGAGDVATASVAQLALLRWMQGRLGELAPIWDAVLARFPGVPAYAAARTLIDAHGGQPHAAAREVGRLVADGLAGIPRDFLWKATLYLLADACAETDNAPAAVPLYDALLPYSQANAAINYIVPLGSIARVTGRLAALLERWDDARQHFETALEANERMGFRAWAAWTRLHYGELLLRRPGSRDAGVALLNEALAFAGQSGMGKVQRDSELLLAWVD